MAHTLPELKKDEFVIPVPLLRRLADDWLLDCDLRQHSAKTQEDRRRVLNQMFWFFERRHFDAIGTSHLKAFIAYLLKGHTEPGGRWGKASLTKPLSPTSVVDYFRIIRSMFNWLEKDEAISYNPIRKVSVPVARAEVKQPISDEHIRALLNADTFIVLAWLQIKPCASSPTRELTRWRKRSEERAEL